MQIKFSESSAKNRYPFTHSHISKSQIELSLKTSKVATQDMHQIINRAKYINQLSAKIKLMEEKIKGKSDNISPGYLRNNEKVVKKRHLQSFSSFDGFPIDQKLQRPGFLKYSFQDTSEIKFLPEFQKETSVKKQRKFSNNQFTQLFQRQNSKQILLRKNEIQKKFKENVLNTSIQIPLIQGLNRDNESHLRSVFSCSLLTKEGSKGNHNKNIHYQINQLKMVNEPIIQRKFSKDLKGIKSDKIANSLNKSLSLLQMMKRPKDIQTSVQSSKRMDYLINNQADKKKKKRNQEINERGCFKQFVVKGIIGKGKFGEVYLAKHITTGCIVALKKVMKSKLIEYKIVDQFIKEIKLHNSMNHHKIVKFYGFFEEQESFYLILEYMNGGTLFDYLNSKGSLKIKEVVSFLKDVIQGLVYMHERSIAHRDLKPQNIVLTQEVAKLCDFGWAAVFQGTRKTYCGTLDYATPQILQRRSYDISVDIWSIGVLTYELLMGRAPFQDKDRSVVRQRIVNSDKFDLEYSENVPYQAQKFIQWLIQRDPQKRPKITELLDHEMFQIYALKTHKKSF